MFPPAFFLDKSARSWHIAGTESIAIIPPKRRLGRFALTQRQAR